MKPTAILILLGILAPALPARADLAAVQRQIDALRREIAAERQMLEAELARRARVEADSLRRLPVAQDLTGRDQAAGQERLQDGNRRFALALAGQVDSAVARLAREAVPCHADPKVRALKELSLALRAGVIPPEQGLAQALDRLSELRSWTSRVEARAGSLACPAGAPLHGYPVRVGGVFEGSVTVPSGLDSGSLP